MLNMLRKIDDVVFDTPTVGVQALANYLQYYFDIKPMAVSRCFLGVEIVVMAVIMSFAYPRVPLNEFLPLSFLIVLGVAAMSTLYLRTYEIEDVLGKMTRNYRRADEFFLVLRTFQLTLIVWGLWQHWIALLLTVPMAGYMYFSCADHLPPLERYQWRKPVTAEV